jgi:hypothetical protein
VWKSEERSNNEKEDISQPGRLAFYSTLQDAPETTNGF